MGRNAGHRLRFSQEVGEKKPQEEEERGPEDLDSVTTQRQREQEHPRGDVGGTPWRRG